MNTKQKNKCLLAVQKLSNVLVFVQKQFRTKELYLLDVNKWYNALNHVPLQYIILELCKIAIKNNNSDFNL